MTLVFNGQQFKYEMEGVVKLFIPAQKFSFLYDADVSEIKGDFCLGELKEDESSAKIRAVLRMDESTIELCGEVSKSVENYTGKCEIAVCSLVFKGLSALTGKTVPWGILTGVRPVKRVNKMLENGLSKKDIEKELREVFFVSKDKTDLAYKTAIAQREILKHNGNRMFSLYVSIPFCPSRCAYCSFVSQEVEKSLKLIPQYIFKLCRELEEVGRISKKLGLTLDTIYFGGGTPTSVEASHLEAIMKTIEQSFDLSDLREYTVEAGRADTITADKLRIIKAMGAKRISINPQTLNNSVLQAIGRRHTAEDFYEKFDMARKIGFDCINTDLIAGLPTDTPQSFEKTVCGITELAPENVTIHTLSVKRTADLNLGDSNKEKYFESPAAKMVDFAAKKLTEMGYSPYYLYKQKNMLDNLENVGWSKPGRESLYNIYIMEEVQTILAVGAGASTKLCDNESKRIERIFNYKLPLEYIKNFDLMIEKKKEIERFYNGE